MSTCRSSSSSSWRQPQWSLHQRFCNSSGRRDRRRSVVPAPTEGESSSTAADNVVHARRMYCGSRFLLQIVFLLHIFSTTAWCAQTSRKARKRGVHYYDDARLTSVCARGKKKSLTENSTAEERCSKNTQQKRNKRPSTNFVKKLLRRLLKTKKTTKNVRKLTSTPSVRTGQEKK